MLMVEVAASQPRPENLLLIRFSTIVPEETIKEIINRAINVNRDFEKKRKHQIIFYHPVGGNEIVVTSDN